MAPSSVQTGEGRCGRSRRDRVLAWRFQPTRNGPASSPQPGRPRIADHELPLNSPLFSIVIPSYNRPEFLRAAVESVLASTYGDFEVLVSDDCSPRQAEIIQAMERHASDTRVRFVAQPRNLGEPANRAFLFESARGEWLLPLSDDDKLYPHALEVLHRAIESEPGARLFTFGYTLIDEFDGEKYSRRAPRLLRIHRDDEAVLSEFLVSDAFPYWFYQPATFCAHRKVRERIQPNPDIGMGDDLQFLFDFVNHDGTIVVVPEVLMYYRKISERATHLQRNQSLVPLANFRTRYLMLGGLERRADLCPQIRSLVARYEFRERFVYQNAVADGFEPSGVLREIEMEPRHREEFIRYSETHSRLGLRTSGYLRRARFFVRLFGWAGVAEVLRVAAQRVRSRIRSIMPRG